MIAMVGDIPVFFRIHELSYPFVFSYNTEKGVSEQLDVHLTVKANPPLLSIMFLSDLQWEKCSGGGKEKEEDIKGRQLPVMKGLCFKSLISF